jgi:hypothetical protein
MENDLEILYPDQTVTVGAETVTMREYRYREGLEAAGLARLFLAGLRALMTDTGEEIALEAIDGLIAEHRETWLQLVALSCGREVEWLAQLPNHEAMKLHLAFWGVNGPFFTQRLVLAAAFAQRPKAGRSPSRKSSPNSSGPDSDETTVTLENDSRGASSNAIST